MLNFLVAFFLKISETLKAHLWNENRYLQTVKAFFLVFNGLSY